MTERWSGHLGFILAAVGGAVGLGSIWKFPYEAGANGGGTFILFYVAGLVLAVLPLMLIEVAIGRRGRAGPAESLAAIAREAGRSPHWRWAGVFGVLTGGLILSFYAVIGGWTLGHAFEVVAGADMPRDPAEARRRFEAHLADPAAMTLHFTIFMAVTATIVSAGVASGIEAACRWMMPALVAVLLALAVFALVAGDGMAALRFLFAVDPQRITARAAVDALGLGFFSIGVGLGFMITYGAYAEPGIDLLRVVRVTMIADTMISLLAGFAVFPIVFAYGLDPASGPGLMFVTLPLAFARMPAGAVVAFAFYALLTTAATTSAISLLELVVAWLMNATRLSRRAATALAAATCWVAGLGTVLSFNRWSGWHPAAFLPGFERATLFDLIDYATSNVMLPVGGILFAVFGGWVMTRAALAGELGLGARGVGVLRFVLRYVLPVLLPALLLAPFLARA